MDIKEQLKDIKERTEALNRYLEVCVRRDWYTNSISESKSPA